MGRCVVLSAPRRPPTAAGRVGVAPLGAAVAPTGAPPATGRRGVGACVAPLATAGPRPPLGRPRAPAPVTPGVVHVAVGVLVRGPRVAPLAVPHAPGGVAVAAAQAVAKVPPVAAGRRAELLSRLVVASRAPRRRQPRAAGARRPSTAVGGRVATGVEAVPRAMARPRTTRAVGRAATPRVVAAPLRSLPRVVTLPVPVDGAHAPTVAARPVPSAVARVAVLRGPEAHIALALRRTVAENARVAPRRRAGASAPAVRGAAAGRAAQARPLPFPNPAPHGEVPRAALLAGTAPAPVARVAGHVKARVATVAAGPTPVVAMEAAATPKAAAVPVAQVAQVAAPCQTLPPPLALKVGLRRAGTGLPRRPRLLVVHLGRAFAGLCPDRAAKLLGERRRPLRQSVGVEPPFGAFAGGAVPSSKERRPLFGAQLWVGQVLVDVIGVPKISHHGHRVLHVQ